MCKVDPWITTYAHVHDFYHRREKKHVCMCNVNISHSAARDCSSHIYSRAWKRDLRIEDTCVYSCFRPSSRSLDCNATLGICNIFWENRSIKDWKWAICYAIVSSKTLGDDFKILFSHKVVMSQRSQSVCKKDFIISERDSLLSRNIWINIDFL